jgi:hypothetical protein
MRTNQTPQDKAPAYDPPRCTTCHRANHLPGTYQGHPYTGPDPAWTREDQAAEDAKHAGEQWPPGNGDPYSGIRKSAENATPVEVERIISGEHIPYGLPSQDPDLAPDVAAEEWEAEYPEHDCPRDAFLEDPITVAYGVGSEMVHLIPCSICDAEGS